MDHFESLPTRTRNAIRRMKIVWPHELAARFEEFCFMRGIGRESITEAEAFLRGIGLAPLLKEKCKHCGRRIPFAKESKDA